MRVTGNQVVQEQKNSIFAAVPNCKNSRGPEINFTQEIFQISIASWATVFSIFRGSGQISDVLGYLVPIKFYPCG